MSRAPGPFFDPGYLDPATIVPITDAPHSDAPYSDAPYRPDVAEDVPEDVETEPPAPPAPPPKKKKKAPRKAVGTAAKAVGAAAKAVGALARVSAVLARTRAPAAPLAALGRPLAGGRPAPAAAPAPDASGFVLFEAGHPGLRVSGKKVPPVVRKDGRPAYEVLYRAGKVHPGGTNTSCTFAPAGFFPSEQCRFRFRLWVDAAFPWEGVNPRQVGGKIIGFKVGTGDASGGNYSPTGATFRLTWAFHGGVGPYLYPQVRRAHSAARSGEDISWEDLDQSPEVQKVAYVAKGVHMFYPKDKKDPGAWDLRLRKGAWNDVEMFMRLNTPGRYDGVLATTINGASKSISSVRYRYDDAKINGIVLGTFFGGGTTKYAPPTDVRNLYADFAFSAT